MRYLARFASYLTIWQIANLQAIYPLQAQPATSPIIPAQDGTQTEVTINGNRFDIQGGQLSGDGANLFHSFEKFGLNNGQMANFLSNPKIQNILGRVIGGEVSSIDGLIQVMGGNSNLFLMNPAGIIFGPNASLNIPASFTATTASGIGFGNHQWFNALGSDRWQALMGTPSEFRFDALNPGSIVNLGNLAVGSGQTLTLLGGNVINIGTLSAAGGTITVAAVPGANLLRLSQTGHLLSLEITPHSSPLTVPNPKSLPELLTGSQVGHASGIAVTPQGQVVLTGSNTVLPQETGTAIASGSINVSGEMGGAAYILGDRVAAIAGNIDASGNWGGGRILLGGDYQGRGSVPNASFTHVSPDATLSADALHSGNGGRIIVWADHTTRFDGNIRSRGGAIGGNGGFAEVSGKIGLEFRGAADLQATVGQVGTLLLDPTDITIGTPDAGGTFTGGVFSPSSGTSSISIVTLQNQLNLGDVTISSADGSGGNGDITVVSPFTFNLGAPRTLTLNAFRHLQIDQPIVGATGSQPLNLVLYGNGGNLTGGEGRVIINSAIDTLGGNITAIGSSLAEVGVLISGSGTTLNSQGGNITLQGISDGGHGLQLMNSATLNAGIGGHINVTGLSNTNGSNKSGIYINNDSRIQTGGVGNITLNGTSGTGANANTGIRIQGNSVIEVQDGTISLTGTSRGDTNNNHHGISLATGGVVRSTGSGNITLVGMGGNGTDSNFGIAIEGIGSGVFSTSGAIALTGMGGNGTGSNNSGIFLGNSATIQSTTGNITLDGTSGSGGISNNHGIEIYANNGCATQITTTDGAIAITGQGQGTGSENHGISIQVENSGAATASIQATGNGSITLNGTSTGTNSNNNGVRLTNAGSLVKTEAGSIAIAGNSAVTEEAIRIENGSVQSNGGDITLNSLAGSLFGNTPLVSNGGDITITTTSSSSNITLNTVNSGNAAGGGKVTIAANNNILTSDISSSASSSSGDSGNGGAISLSAGGRILTGSLNTQSESLGDGNSGTGGAVQLTAGSDIIIGDTVTLSQRPNAVTPGVSGNGGAISIQTSSNINVGNLVTASTNPSGDSGNGGAVTLTTGSNLVVTGHIATTATATDGSAGSGGNVNLQATNGNISISNLIPATVNSIATSSTGSAGTTGNSGAIEIQGNGLISIAGGLDASNSGVNAGGPITLVNSGGDLDTTGKLIDASSQAGDGGAIVLSAFGNLATGQLNASTQGLDGGSIAITTNTGTLTVNGGVTTSAPGTAGSITLTGGQAIVFNATTPDDSIDAKGLGTTGNGGNITLNGNVTLNQPTLVLDGSGVGSGTSHITFNDRVDGIQAGTNALTIHAGTGNVTFHQGVGSTIPLGNLTVNAGGTTLFQDVVNANHLLTDAGGITQLNSNAIATGTVIFQDAVQLLADITITSNNNAISFGNTVDGNYNLTLNSGSGDISFQDAIGKSNPLLQLIANSSGITSFKGDANAESLTTDAAGSSQLGGNINTTGAIALLDPVNLVADVTIDSSNGDINFGNSIDGPYHLTLNSVNGDLTFGNAIGGVTPLGNLTANSGGTTFLNIPVNATSVTTDVGGTTLLGGNITTQGNVSFQDPVTLTANVSISSNNGSISFSNSVDGTQDLLLNSGAGNITFDREIGGVAPLGNLTLNGTGSTFLNGTIRLASLTTDPGGTTQIGGSIFSSGPIGIRLEDPTSLIGNLTLKGDEIDFSDSISGTENVVLETFTPNQNIEIGGPVDTNALDLTATDIGHLQDGFTSIAIGSDSGNNTLSLAGDVTFTDPLTLRSPFGSFHSNQFNLFGNDNASLTFETAARLGGNITTNNNPVTFNQTVTLESGTQINTGSVGGEITFKETVNGTQDLTLNAGEKNIDFQTAIGNGTALGNLTANSTGQTRFAGSVSAIGVSTNSGGTTELNGNLNATGDVRILDAVILQTNLEVNSNGGNIEFGSTLNGGYNLAVNSGSGNISFSQAIGDIAPLGSLIANSTGLTQFNNSVQATSLATDGGGTAELGGNITTQGIVSLAESIALTADVTVNSNNGNISFGNAVSGSQNLTLNAGSGSIQTQGVSTNNLTLTGNTIDVQGPLSTSLGDIAIANSGPLTFAPNSEINSTGTFVQSGSGSVSLGGNINAKGITFSGSVNLTNDLNLNSNNGSIQFQNTLDGSHNLNLAAGTGDITLNGIVGGISPLGNLNITNANDLTANQNIYATSITHTQGIGHVKVADLQTTGGDIVLTTKNQLTTGNLETAGGAIRLTSETASINTGNLNSAAATGGEIHVNALQSINTGAINSRGSSGNAGNVTLDPIGDIQATSIDARGGPNGNGGTVNVTTGQFFRVTGSFPCTAGNCSISTEGGTGGGLITITHGGNGITPFTVGNATTNGTAGQIITQETSLAPGDYYYTFFQPPNIQVNSVPSPTPTPTPVASPTPESTSTPISPSIPITTPVETGTFVEVVTPIKTDTPVEVVTPIKTDTSFEVVTPVDTPLSIEPIFSQETSILVEEIVSTIASNVTNSESIREIAPIVISTPGVSITAVERSLPITPPPLRVSVTAVERPLPMTPPPLTEIANSTLTTPNLQISLIPNSLPPEGKDSVASSSPSSNAAPNPNIRPLANPITQVPEAVSPPATDRSSISISVPTIDFSNVPQPTAASPSENLSASQPVGSIPQNPQRQTPIQSTEAPAIADPETKPASPNVKLPNLSNSNNRQLEDANLEPQETSLSVKIQTSDRLNSTNNAGQSSTTNSQTNGSSASNTSSQTTLGYGAQADRIFEGNDLGASVANLELMRNGEFESYLGIKSPSLNTPITISHIQNVLKAIAKVPGKQSAMIYVVVRNEQLELILIPPEGEPIRKSIPEAKEASLLPVVQELRTEVTNPRKRRTKTYQSSARQLYQWIVTPLEPDLQRLGIETLLFSLDPGLRSLPMAALLDGDRFLVEKYSFSLIPSFSLLETQYASMADSKLLAMGASEFKEFPSLPAVPLELKTLTQEWETTSFLNASFTIENLKNQQKKNAFRIVHLATHAEFAPGKPQNSFILFWNERLQINQISRLSLHNPQVDLLVLSACRTALGDREAELGFAGLAVQAGVKSALASLWYIEDEGTLSLMGEFYKQLRHFSTKAEALQQAQLAMIQGKVRFENGKLIKEGQTISLPSESSKEANKNMAHPYYWSGFTLVGSPW